MQPMVRLMILTLLLVFTSSAAQAQKSRRGTPDEAIAMVKKVKRMYRTIGPEKTFKAVSNLTHGLKDRDLYPYVGHIDGYIVAHFIYALRGLNITESQDMRRRYYFRNMMSVVKNKGKGWANYSFPNPITKKVEDKAAYIERLDHEYFVAVGVFTKISDDQIKD